MARILHICQVMHLLAYMLSQEQQNSTGTDYTDVTFKKNPLKKYFLSHFLKFNLTRIARLLSFYGGHFFEIPLTHFHPTLY